MSRTGPACRIVSFLPSATEMTYALGLGDRLMGVTHECDHPQEARTKPVVVKSILPVETMTQREIDDAVTARLRAGESLYQVDEVLLAEIAPDIILTQDLCQVCAPSGNEITRALAALPSKPEILWLTPKSLNQIFDNVRTLAAATDRVAKAESLITDWQARLRRIETRAQALPYRPRVFCMEWIDPVYCCGHWVPEMVRIAGGVDALGREGTDSVRLAWDDVLRWAPEVLVVMPCGFGLGKALEHAWQLQTFPGWLDIPAVRDGRVYVVDANSYFARPGPRVVEGTELLAHLFHPDAFDWPGPHDAYARLLPNVRSPEEKQCSACGAPFICGPQPATNTCWCEALPHIVPENAVDCLCPTCLANEVTRRASHSVALSLDTGLS
jgi:iron complex transport system substrate-binding protein